MNRFAAPIFNLRYNWGLKLAFHPPATPSRSQASIYQQTTTGVIVVAMTMTSLKMLLLMILSSTMLLLMMNPECCRPCFKFSPIQSLLSVWSSPRPPSSIHTLHSISCCLFQAICLFFLLGCSFFKFARTFWNTFVSSVRSSYSDVVLLHTYIHVQLFQIFTQSIDAIDVTSVTLCRLDSINAIDV